MATKKTKITRKLEKIQSTTRLDPYRNFNFR